MGLGVWAVSGIGKTIHEAGNQNRPPCLRNRIFTDLVHKMIGVVGVAEYVSV